MASLAERFWAKVQPGAPGECWEWLAQKDHGGYGRFKLASGHQVFAHRIAYQLAKPSMFDPALCVLHTCDNRGCCRPGHLFQGTIADNNQDKVNKGRQLRGVTHGRAKLTDKQVLAIRADPRSSRELAEIYEISASLVRQIKQRGIWKHL